MKQEVNMDLKDYSDKDQEEIKKGPPVAEIDDKEAAEKIQPQFQMNG